MISTIARDTQKTFEESLLTFERTFPAAPFPRKHIHSVFNDRQEALQAARALCEAGYNAGDVHVMAGLDYIEAVGRGQTLFAALTSTDLDVYLDEAHRGCTLVVVCPSNYGQLLQVRDLLSLHGAYRMKYVDTWTAAQLLP